MDCDLQTLTADGRNRTCFRQGLHHRIPHARHSLMPGPLPQSRELRPELAAVTS